MEDNRFTPVLTLIKNGPIKISGSFVLMGGNKQIIESRGDVFLCRCGKSSKQPFCNGAHKESCS